MITLDTLVIIIGIWIIAIVVRCGINDFIDAEGFEFVNPIYLYNQIKVNWFGVILLTLIWHMLFAPFAIGYWFYKLCTVGRND